MLVSRPVIGVVVEVIEADPLGPGLLAVEHLLDERPLLRILNQLRFNLIPSLELLLEDRLRSALDLHAVIVDQLLQIF